MSVVVDKNPSRRRLPAGQIPRTDIRGQGCPEKGGGRVSQPSGASHPGLGLGRGARLAPHPRHVSELPAKLSPRSLACPPAPPPTHPLPSHHAHSFNPVHHACTPVSSSPRARWLVRGWAEHRLGAVDFVSPEFQPLSGWPASRLACPRPPAGAHLPLRSS